MSIPSQNPPAAILFDLDGTLVDSLPDLLRAMNGLLSEMGRPPVTIQQVRGWVGDGAAPLVERAMLATGGPSDISLPELVKRYLGHYEGNTAVDTRPFPGVERTLQRLKAAGHPLGVCTNKPTALSLELLDALGLSSLFGAIVGGDTVAARKPDPAHLRATLDAMGMEGRRALMVGDSANDVAAARAAGIPVVAVAFGYSRIDPKDLGADVLIEDFTTLPDAAAQFL